MLTSLLKNGLEEINLSFEESQVKQLKDYLELLIKWNKAYNLTAITEPRKMVAYHVLDSLAILNEIPHGGLCLDVGTGAGLPGIPLAIMLPESTWVLLDSNGKKTRFVQQAIASCGLSNVKVVHSRIQDYHAESSFDVIVSRAFSSVSDFVSSVTPVWQTGTRLITMKTELSEAELKPLDSALYKLEINQLQVPGIAEKRSLVTIQRQDI
ncbi:MAG: 16S rRNA (guanine(527)-N(7))-methyltransferase RsmG [Gammaproteobacteria bacterium]|nr:16S rRNA (guanine(527)-N(7))-methyltransferase RsmG [Gammaproteobacteria bacterium]